MIEELKQFWQLAGCHIIEKTENNILRLQLKLFDEKPFGEIIALHSKETSDSLYQELLYYTAWLCSGGEKARTYKA